MHWWPGGLITIITYGGIVDSLVPINVILTESAIPILTETSNYMLTESGL
jgi:hypothetical protein